SADPTTSASFIAATASRTAAKATSTAAVTTATPAAQPARPARSPGIARRASAITASASREANHETHSSFVPNAPRPGVRGRGAGAGGLDAGSHGDQVRPGTHQSRSGGGQGPARAGAPLVEPAWGPGQRRAKRPGADECRRRTESGARRRARYPRGVLRLPVPVLRALLRDDAPGPQEGLHR